MDSLAYFHVADAYENEDLSNDLVSLSRLLKGAAAPNWNKLSSRAWKYMLPVALTVSVLSVVSSALALESGDRGPSVRNLQQKLKTAGFYQATITQVYDKPTEDAVRRFQKAAGLPVNGVAEATTVQKLNGWRTKSAPAQAQKPNNPTNAQKPNSESNSVASKRRNANYLIKGDEGENVRVLQERLRVAGFYYGNSTGIFGSITEEAVKGFQQAYNLDADGVVGPATLAKLPPTSIGDGDDSPKANTDKDKLGLGDRGEGVRVLQQHLIKAGYLQGEPNGYFGPYTADAVKRFQTANYLASSGVAGPTTRAKLYSLVSNDSPKSEFSVLEIQRRLRERGFYKGPLNGVMGNDTKQAIKQAQQFYGISLKDLKSGSF